MNTTIDNLYAAFKDSPPELFLDVQKGLSGLAGNEKMYLKALNLLLNKAPTLQTILTELFSKIPDNPDQAAFKDYVTYVHGLKGSFASVGALGMSNLFKELELAGKNLDKNFCASNNNIVINKTSKFMQTLSSVLLSTPAKNLNDDSLLARELRKLSISLSEFDFAKTKSIIDSLLESSKSSSFGDDIDAKIIKMKQLSDDFLTFDIEEMLKNDFPDFCI